MLTVPLSVQAITFSHRERQEGRLLVLGGRNSIETRYADLANVPAAQLRRVHADPARGRFAIADGATESSFAGEWARLLVEGFVQTPHAGCWPNWSNWLPTAQQLWLAEVDGRCNVGHVKLGGRVLGCLLEGSA